MGDGGAAALDALDRARRALKDARKERDDARAELASLRQRVGQLEALNETAWGIIANAGEGDWGRESAEWNTAARQWHERWTEVRPAIAPAGEQSDG